MTGEVQQRETAHGFDFLDDPVLVVTQDGGVLEANASARAFFGSRLAAGKLSVLLADANEDCAAYMRLASRSTAPVPGKFSFEGEKGGVPFRTQAARSRQGREQAQVILRLVPLGLDRFAMLDRRVKDLDAQLHKRLRENAALQEALRHNQTLLRELQHRVKNNIQIMLSLIKMAARGRDTPEVAAVVHTSHGRLQAMAAVQEALYQADTIEFVPARDFLTDVVRTAARANGALDALRLSLEDAELTSDEAHCLALIANELISNAARYGLPDGQGTIAVTFAHDGDKYIFEVEDAGPGIPVEAAGSASGLALVRGLCRQIGGRLEMGGGKGTRCAVQFRADNRQRKQA